MGRFSIGFVDGSSIESVLEARLADRSGAALSARRGSRCPVARKFSDVIGPGGGGYR